MGFSRDDFLGMDGQVHHLVEQNGNKGIYGLFGKYRALSNFHVSTLVVDGIEYRSSEAAYMAQKTHILEEKLECARQPTPKDVKKYGQTVTLRPDWEKVKVSEMERVLMAKFTQAPELGTLLLDTGDLYIEETNWWGDNFWGVSDLGLGQNNLGKVLMRVRDHLKMAAVK